MSHARTVVRAARLTVRNPFAVVLVSVATTVSILPVLTGLYLAGVIGGLVGLWTTSILLGFVAVGGARIATVLLERELSLGTSYFWEGIRAGGRMGPTVGIGTFVVVLSALVLVLNPLEGVLGVSVSLVGVYVLMAWFVVATFALARWAAFDSAGGVNASFAEGWLLVLERPAAAMWVLVQTVGWTLLAIPLIIAPVLVLPGFVQLVAVAIVREAAEEDASSD